MFLVGVLLSMYLSFLLLTNDPKDTYGMQEWLNKREISDYETVDQPLGYEYAKKMQEERRSEKPSLYDA